MDQTVSQGQGNSHKPETKNDTASAVAESIDPFFGEIRLTPWQEQLAQEFIKEPKLEARFCQAFSSNGAAPLLWTLEIIRRFIALDSNRSVNALWNVGWMALADGIYTQNKMASGQPPTDFEKWALFCLVVIGGGLLGWSTAESESLIPDEPERTALKVRNRLFSDIDKIVTIHLNDSSPKASARIDAILETYNSDYRKMIRYVVNTRLKLRAGDKE